MARRMLAVALVLMLCAAASAHLCNDVFVQAKDNLAVKVDIRDGQLRVGKSATFRVYLLNTMDRDIVTIALQVRSKEFNASVKPSQMRLRTVKRGGKKEYYEVTLNRKPGVPDGRYKIDLHLFNPKRPSQVFKTVDLESAANVMSIKKAAAVNVDGNATRTEWAEAPLCTGFHSYVKAGRYMENRTAGDQARFRVTADDENVYCSLDFLGAAGAQSDVAALHVAKTHDDTPVVIKIDRVKGSLSSPKGTAGIAVKASADRKSIECRIPRKLLGVEGVKTFYFNFTRTITQNGRTEVTYWKGNDLSMDEPISFAQMVVAD